VKATKLRRTSTMTYRELLEREDDLTFDDTDFCGPQSHSVNAINTYPMNI
jgi:hypothetical protein